MVWDPAWGKERITNMIATRPDWCISRQRIWGVPIAVFLCEGCNQPIIDAELNRKIVDLFEREGAEAWHTTDVAALLPAGAMCALRRQSLPQRDRHSRRLVRLRRELAGGLRVRSGPQCGVQSLPKRRGRQRRRCCISRAATSTAAGSTRRC